jgi:predicted TIM-barrel fold metal-dependent hydrolase
VTIIDADCHFETRIDRDEHPLAEWLDDLPPVVELIREAVTGDIGRGTPEADRPPREQVTAFLPYENRRATEFAFLEAVDGEDPGFVVSNVKERLAWMDEIGIDYAIINPGAWFVGADFVADRIEAFRRCNDFLADRLEGATDRLLPVTLVDCNDLDKAAAELRRMRDRGSRAFWLEARPFNDTSPAHQSWDHFWSTATDLGMLAVLHVGRTPVDFRGWGNAGWMQPGGAGLAGYFSLGNALRHQGAEMLLATMVYGGVFDRHPNLTVITEELLVQWIPSFVDRCTSFGKGDVARRNIRTTPLIGVGDRDALDRFMPQIPEMMVFSSDYPHGEGNATPLAALEPALSELSDDDRRRFLGENLLDCFARMGDPLPRA